jgi:uncharacterized protein YggE
MVQLMPMQNTYDYKKFMFIAGTIALLAVSFAAVAVGLENLSERKHPNGTLATITVSGDGKATATTTIATVTFTVRESAKTVVEAQKNVETKITQALAGIMALGIESKDVTTLSYNVTPKYESQPTGYCNGYVCPPGKTIVTGYEVSENVSVKVRKVDSAGDLLAALGKAAITEISGPLFSVDDMDQAKAEARAQAIKKAQAEARVTANALGVSLGEITQFSEDGGRYQPQPVMYKADSMMSSQTAGTVTLPQGENVINSHVTITYSLR